MSRAVVAGFLTERREANGRSASDRTHRVSSCGAGVGDGDPITDAGGTHQACKEHDHRRMPGAAWRLLIRTDAAPARRPSRVPRRGEVDPTRPACTPSSGESARFDLDQSYGARTSGAFAAPPLSAPLSRHTARSTPSQTPLPIADSTRLYVSRRGFTLNGRATAVPVRRVRATSRVQLERTSCRAAVTRRSRLAAMVRALSVLRNSQELCR